MHQLLSLGKTQFFQSKTKLRGLRETSGHNAHNFSTSSKSSIRIQALTDYGEKLSCLTLLHKPAAKEELGASTFRYEGILTFLLSVPLAESPISAMTPMAFTVGAPPIQNRLLWGLLPVAAGLLFKNKFRDGILDKFGTKTGQAEKEH